MDLFKILIDFSIYGGISISLFLMGLLSQDWKKYPAKKVLAGILSCFVGFLIMFLLLKNQELFLVYGLPILMIAIFALGPLVFFYVSAIYKPDFKFDKLFLQHFYPLGVALIVLGVFRLFVSEPFQVYGIVFTLSIGLILLWYYVLRAFRNVLRYRKIIPQVYSHYHSKDLDWLTKCILGIIVVLVLDLVMGIILSSTAQNHEAVYWSVIFYSGFVVYLGYKGMQQQTVFLPSYLHAKKEQEKLESPAKEHSSELPETLVPELSAKLKLLFETDRIYTNENLNLRLLAEQMNISEKQLSELLNMHLSTNFYDWVNGYRVKAFKEKVISGKIADFTILALALECGFSSKSSFNRIFKQQTGRTPSKFIAERSPK